MKSSVTWCSLSWLLWVLCGAVQAQETVNPRSSSTTLAGGGGSADFTELMNLIQQTIDPQAWIDASSTMVPYPSGVYVDPQGQLRQVKIDRETERTSWSAVRQGPQHPWRSESKLRIISVRGLDESLSLLRSRGLRPSPEVQALAGLSRIDFVKFDVAHEDILLAGPANIGLPPGASGPPGFLLEDLALLTSLVNTQTAPLGCSIDPTDSGVLAAQQLIEAAGATQRLSSNPQKFTDQMQEKIGPHNVSIYGMPANSPTALALVAADEHMKQIGFGTATTSVPIAAYFDHLERQANVPQQSLIRWWFSFANQPILCNASRDIFRLPQKCVVLLSEQQWVSQLGRKATGDSDLCADAFAAEMTAKINELRLAHPAYARMCAIFEMALALQVALEASGQPAFHSWFPHLVQSGRFANDEIRAPKTVSGLSAWHKLSNGTIVAVVSGGVSIHARKLASRSRWLTNEQASEFTTMEPAAAAISHGNWWWDEPE